MNISFTGKDSSMFPTLLDNYTFKHIFSGLLAYIILHKFF